MEVPPVKRSRQSSPTRSDVKSIHPNFAEPGFFDLNLRLLLEVDQAEKEYMRDEQEMELKWTHPCVHPVIKNIMAILHFTMPLFQSKAITELEKVLEEYPDNLNTMANLVRMRKELKQDYTDVETRLKTAIESDNDIEKARVELEKGYVYLMDLHSEVKTSVARKLRQADEQLRLQLLDEGRSHLRKHYEKARDSLKEAEKIMNNIPVSCTLSTKHSRELSHRLFESGIDKLSKLSQDKDEEAMWKHYLGKTFNRLGTTSRKKQSFLKAIEMFVFVIEHLSSRFDNGRNGKDDENENGLRNCLARTYAYLGHLVKIKWNIIVSKSDPNPPDCLGTGIGIKIWNDPMHAFVKAEEVSEDRVILNKHALTLLNDTTPDFDKSEEYLKKSLKMFPNTNWFALAIMTQLYVKWYQSELHKFNAKIKSDSPKEPRDELLRKAIEMGKKCLKQKTTSDTLLFIAKSHYYLGMNPKQETKLKKRVRDETRIRKAFIYVQRAKDRHECSHHSDMYALFGKCLFHLGHMDEARKQMQLAIETEGMNVKEPTNFKHFCEFLLEDYKIQQKKNYTNKCQELIRQLWLITDESVRKYGKRMDYPLIGIANNYPHPIIHLIRYLKSRKDQYGPSTARTVGILLQTLCRHNGPRVRERATDEKVTLPEDFGEVSSIAENGNTLSEGEMRSGPESNISLQNHDYDFYVCYSEGDRDWVHDIFMDRLETRDGSGYRGCLRGRDIETKGDIEFVLKKCKYFIFVISENFNISRQCVNELDIILLRQINLNSVIPVLRGSDKMIPDRLNIYNNLDFSKPPYDFDKLLRCLQGIDDCEDEDEENEEA